MVSFHGSIFNHQTVDDAAHMALESSVGRLKESLEEATPIDTGLAAKSWETNEIPHGFHITNTTEYIAWVNDGTDRIEARRFVEEVLLDYVYVEIDQMADDIVRRVTL